MAKHQPLETNERPLTRSERVAKGHAIFDYAKATRDGSLGRVHASARDRFADAYAAITRPFGGR